MELLRVESPEAVRQPQAYVYRIASHVVYRFKRRRQRENELVTFDSDAFDRLGEQAGEERDDTNGGQLDAQQEIERLLAQLPPLHQAILLMRKRDGMSYAQVAQKLGISVHTVKKYLHRAMVQMRGLGWDSAQERKQP